MDRLQQLQSYSVKELVDELRRRITELDEARALLALAGDPGKKSRMSEAKAAYWQGWHEYKAAHPDATVDEWRRSQRRTTKRK
jgi:hypothetical protein